MILISPLNWGIGHAARIMTFIRIFQKYNVPFIVAADGKAYYFLKRYLTDNQIVIAPNLIVKYPKKGKYMPLKILIQMPKFILFILKNKLWLKKIIKKYQVSVIISDNRFGFNHPLVYNIFISHQLNIRVPEKYSFAKKLIDILNCYEIKKYDEVWVPDFSTRALSGELSLPVCKKIGIVRYINPLSRFMFYSSIEEIELQCDILLIISGAEPQRTIFQQLLLEQMPTDKKIVLLSGKPDLSYVYRKKNIKIFSHIDDDVYMAALIKKAKIIIARAGYSTIMDLIALGKTAILVPTPGQTEQEYLARYLQEKQLYISFEQENFSFSEAIKIFNAKKNQLQKNILKLRNSLKISNLENLILKNLLVKL